MQKGFSRMPTAAFVILTVAACLLASRHLFGQEPNPSADVSDLTMTCISCTEQTGSFTITNVTDEPAPVTIETITGSIEFIGRRGKRTTCTTPTFAFSAGPGTVIGPGEELLVTYTATCGDPCPDEARELKNFVDVKLVGRNKLFHGSGSCDLEFEDD